MSRPAQKAPASSVDIDALLMDTYLLVVELRACEAVQIGPELWQRCAAQIQQVREALDAAGMDQRSIDGISQAQCALLDETILGCAQDEVHTKWTEQTLQARFFNHHQAGESLYEDMRTLLREPAANPQVLTVFQRVLMMGFLGRYRDINDPERQQLLATLTAQVGPLDLTQSVITQPVTGLRHRVLSRLQRPLLHGVAAALLLVGTWWGLDEGLGRTLATLVGTPG
ncbi:hypothetical protein CCOS865_04234 [Pseudomonas reidholzensis]|uniref:Type IV / VI secretion system DotU domain-containing protein n=1 Tax=Pseudomonas reidholzensis TaxID=1785162 RepID=A0A383RZ88_9PSED|nr:type VI secretion system protein TssL, short form [Pseudomonas reidholzensis]SYX91954.1 hypothetical protein CCOS865_04234 [Pseudomonas reidholzensis]